MTDKWTRSRAMLERARRSLAGGVSSPFRVKAPVPLYFRNGCGARLEDVDGNEYIDYVLAWGPMILGYRHPAIVEAMRRQTELPADYGAQHELEFAVSEQIQSMLPCAELVQFTSSGSEAVQIAFRLARAFTGRNRILKFEGHYHGWLDGALISYKPAGAAGGAAGRAERDCRFPRTGAQLGGQLRGGAVEPPGNPGAAAGAARYGSGSCRDGAGAVQQRLHSARAGIPGAGAGAVRTARSTAPVRRGDHGIPHVHRRRAGLLWRDAGPGHIRQGGGRRRPPERNRRAARDPAPNVRRRIFRGQFQRQSGVDGVGARHPHGTGTRRRRRAGARQRIGTPADAGHRRNGASAAAYLC